mmetsp:Transcript_21241/g.41663  ORF Transcript_21241/g.41663 Transcript_21241/m.41663 type:complete len:238 (-) Transcript_21241:626-1339(-)
MTLLSRLGNLKNSLCSSVVNFNKLRWNMKGLSSLRSSFTNTNLSRKHAKQNLKQPKMSSGFCGKTPWQSMMRRSAHVSRRPPRDSGLRTRKNEPRLNFARNSKHRVQNLLPQRKVWRLYFRTSKLQLVPSQKSRLKRSASCTKLKRCRKLRPKKAIDLFAWTRSTSERRKTCALKLRSGTKFAVPSKNLTSNTGFFRSNTTPLRKRVCAPMSIREQHTPSTSSWHMIERQLRIAWMM